MNKFIKEQLKKCKIAQIPDFTDKTTELLIPCNNQLSKVDFECGGEYNIRVEDYIIHPYPGFTLHDNWNQGIIPTDNLMHVLVTKDMGKMIQVQAVGLNDNKAWRGWLPKKSCKIL